MFVNATRDGVALRKEGYPRRMSGSRVFKYLEQLADRFYFWKDGSGSECHGRMNASNRNKINATKITDLYPR